MSTPVQAGSPFHKHPDDADTYGFGFANAIGSRTVSSATITVSPSGELVFSNAAANEAEIDDEDGNPIAIGKAVTADGSGGEHGTTYLVTVTATLSDGNTKVGAFEFVVDDGSG